MMQAINRRRGSGGKKLLKYKFYGNTGDNASSGEVREIILPKGTYLLQCYGAQGSSRQDTSSGSHSINGGYGGYSVGTLTLLDSCTVYVRAGGGRSGLATGGFNGGGSGYSIANGGYKSYGGGGASDIRIGTDSLYARVIVAGGGGGAQATSTVSNPTNFHKGGCGGGLSGEPGTYHSNGLQSLGGTQSSGYSFGSGQSAGYGKERRSGGGGGWYGGTTGYRSGGGGGSGYVYTSKTAEYYPSGCLLNSDYYLTDASTTTSYSTQGRVFITQLA